MTLSSRAVHLCKDVHECSDFLKCIINDFLNCIINADPFVAFNPSALQIHLS